MKILHLTLKKKWFDMIASGEKTEEYRDIKPYWNSRLNKDYDAVCFKNGYGKNVPKMTFRVALIRQGLGVVHWGAIEAMRYHIIMLGEAIEN